MVITDSNKNKDDTAIHGNINNKEINESTIITIRAELRQKHSRREHV